MLEELLPPLRDGASQRERDRPELDAGFVALDERGVAEQLAFLQAYAKSLLWHGADGDPAGDWTALFAGLSPEPGPDRLSFAEAAAFAADPAAHQGARFAALRRPHMMLLIACLRLLRHGRDAVNAVATRHHAHQLHEVLKLSAHPARPDSAFVLFDLAPGAEAAEAPAGLRLLAGRDARRRDRVYRLQDGLVVNRARVAAIATSFVDREVVGLAEARRAEPGTPEEKTLALLRLAYGGPKPGGDLPPLRGAPIDAARWRALAQFIGFGRATLFLELFELRALVQRKRRRDADSADWTMVNATLEAAGRRKRGDPAWALNPADPRAFAANVRRAYDGDPMVDNGLEEVATLDDLMLHLDEAAVRDFIATRLFLNVDAQFAPMMAAKRAADADWRVINGFLEAAGRRKRGDPAWTFAPAAPTDFAGNLNIAVGPVEWATAGPEGQGIADVGAWLDRVGEIEAWFFLSGEQLARLLPALDGGDDAPWAEVEALLGEAHGRKVRADERAAMRRIRLAAPAGADGARAALAEATGEKIESPGLLDAIARYTTPADAAFVRGLVEAGPRRRAAASAFDRFDVILAESRRRRLGLSEPVARREHWRALWAEADAPGAAGDGNAWPAFGGVPADAGPARRPATLGWAIASPALALSDGRRRVTLTLAFDADGGGALVNPGAPEDTALKRPFEIELSTGKGWFQPAEASFAQVDYATSGDTAPLEAGRPLIALRIAFTLDEGDPAIAPPAAGFPDGRWPVLRLKLRPVWDGQRYETAYERFGTLRLARAHVRVVVGRQDAIDAPGLFPVDVEAETGTITSKKPFDPFGASAPLGAELAISHPDLLNKRLTSVALRMQWLGAPASLAAHYANYSARDIRGQVSLVDGVRTTALGAPRPLFAADTAAPLRLGDIPLGEAGRADGVVEPPARSVRDRRRYLLLTLAGTDFGHGEYPGLAASKAIALANALRGGAVADTAGFTVRPPYTPRLKRLEVDFTAVHEVELHRYDRATAIDRLFHLHPFGAVEAPDAARGWPLLPAYDEEAALYVGLERVAAPQALSLLFETVPAAGARRRVEGLRWSFLDAGGWADFPEPPADGSLGLARPGIVRFSLPPASPDGRMPAGRYWLRATLSSGADAGAELAGIHAHAGLATAVDDDPQPGRFAAPLPAGAIRAIDGPAPGIARVAQPYPSFGGAPAETDAAFRIRAGERLRHKGRAVSPWDYEHLVLARFPEVHKAKCLPATLADGPGRVRIVIVPDIRAHARADPFAPLAPVSLLDAVRDHLRPLAPAAARLEVVHPHFIRVRVRVGVRFRAGGDEAFNTRRLNEAINRRLAPWAHDEGAEIVLGQRIDATALVAFIDGLGFVDFVGGCRLFQSDNGEDYRPGLDGGEAVVATRADAILTPAPHHEIDLIADDVFAEQAFTGIGYMKVELDFVVA